jgi:hypothetical protein
LPSRSGWPSMCAGAYRRSRSSPRSFSASSRSVSASRESGYLVSAIASRTRRSSVRRSSSVSLELHRTPTGLAGVVTRVSVLRDPHRGHGMDPRPTTTQSLPRSRISAARSISKLAGRGARRAFTSCQYREGEPQSEHHPNMPWPCRLSAPRVSRTIVSMSRSQLEPGAGVKVAARGTLMEPARPLARIWPTVIIDRTERGPV